MNSPGHELESLLNKCMSDKNWIPKHLEFYCVNSDSLSEPQGLKLGLATALGIFQYKNKGNRSIENDVLRILNLVYDVDDKDKYKKKIDEVIRLVEIIVETYLKT